jgi:hypothetical protein
MSGNQSERVRQVATENYVRPERSRGRGSLQIRVAEVKRDLERQGFPPNHTPQICNALRSKRFLQANNLELVSTEGPPSKTSTTVVFHYQFKPDEPELLASGNSAAGSTLRKDAFLRAYGSLKDVFAELGGGEKFLRDLRAGDREV